MNLALSTVTIALGIFVASAPQQAARIWGWENLDQLAPVSKIFYFGCYRTLGVVLCVAGVLFAMDTLAPH